MSRSDWITGGARLSADGAYRYLLWRNLKSSHPGDGLDSGRFVLWIMLNPATADKTHDDRTVSRCVTFSRRWGYRRMEVCNLFAYRATDPKELQTVDDPVGPENKDTIIRAAESADRIVCAWGVGGRLYGQDTVVLDWLAGTGRALHCLGLTADGLPRHPQRFRGEPDALAVFRPGAAAPARAPVAP